MGSNPAKGPAYWKRVEDLYNEALSKPQSERAQFLESACRSDAEMRREVESLLASLEQNKTLLDVPALEVAARILAKPPTSTTLEAHTDLSHSSTLPGRNGEASPARAVLAALAVTAYETLTGALPFPAADTVTWRQSVLAGNYTPLKEHLRDPPSSWQEFFAGCLAVDRERRPPSAIAFSRDLENALA